MFSSRLKAVFCRYPCALSSIIIVLSSFIILRLTIFICHYFAEDPISSSSSSLLLSFLLPFLSFLHHLQLTRFFLIHHPSLTIALSLPFSLHHPTLSLPPTSLFLPRLISLLHPDLPTNSCDKMGGVRAALPLCPPGPYIPGNI